MLGQKQIFYGGGEQRHLAYCERKMNKQLRDWMRGVIKDLSKLQKQAQGKV
jgi:hypothetical protein